METSVKELWFEKHRMLIRFEDDSESNVPLKDFPRLLNATEKQQNSYELWNEGKWIHWEEIDEDLSVEGLLQHQHQSIS